MEEREYFEKLNDYYVKDSEAREDITTLESVVGDSTEGLVKSVSDLETTVGDSTSGLVKDVEDLQTTVGDSTEGLVKDVEDLSSVVFQKGNIAVIDIPLTEWSLSAQYPTGFTNTNTVIISVQWGGPSYWYYPAIAEQMNPAFNLQINLFPTYISVAAFNAEDWPDSSIRITLMRIDDYLPQVEE